MSRPTKLTKQVIETVLGSIKAGQTRETACANAQIVPRTLRDWERHAAAGTAPKGVKTEALQDFFDQIHLQELVTQGTLEQIQMAISTGQLKRKGADGQEIDFSQANHNAVVFRLERAKNRAWLKPEVVEHSGPEGGPIVHGRGVVILPPIEEPYTDEPVPDPGEPVPDKRDGRDEGEAVG